MESDRRMILGVSPPGTEVAWYGSSKDVGSGHSESALASAIRRGRVQKGEWLLLGFRF